MTLMWRTGNRLQLLRVALQRFSFSICQHQPCPAQGYFATSRLVLTGRHGSVAVIFCTWGEGSLLSSIGNPHRLPIRLQYVHPDGNGQYEHRLDKLTITVSAVAVFVHPPEGTACVKKSKRNSTAHSRCHEIYRTCPRRGRVQYIRFPPLGLLATL
jgi:hypothetical protein